MAWIALTGYLALLAVAFGWQSWRQYRRTGDNGLRLAAARGTVQWWARLLFGTAMLAGLAAPVAALLGLPGLATPPAAGVLGAALLLGTLIALPAAQRAMRGSWRVGVDAAERTALVTGGPFRLVRNPIFTILAAGYTGLTLLVPNGIAIAGLAVLITAIQLQVRRIEEPYLLRAHGRRYREYAAATGRFLPRIGRIRTR
ncbi:methyltransferase family protein [Marinactinospora rubrisoli]|uniref:Methyltransferase family protein n=1 Tax=Marinactinospora rubrisoli TaxID=2715399 RepID=A0ABW2KKA7_9ACTN